MLKIDINNGMLVGELSPPEWEDVKREMWGFDGLSTEYEPGSMVIKVTDGDETTTYYAEDIGPDIMTLSEYGFKLNLQNGYKESLDKLIDGILKETDDE